MWCAQTAWISRNLLYEGRLHMRRNAKLLARRGNKPDGVITPPGAGKSHDGF